MTITAPPAAAALDEFRSVVGADAVLTSDEDLREFRDPFAFATWDDYTATAVVTPDTVEQIQEIVRIANRHKVPLWTHGAGRNNGYGGPAPRVKGSVVLSLRRMNRVLEINEECAYAVVEPGVRWFDLYDAIQAGGHRLMLSIADVGWGSVIGNTLDHGCTYMPYGVDMGMQCGMEVVLPNGELLRTGMGAMENNRAWHVYKRGLGPTPDQLFMQSNFGIVTRMGVWLMPYPEVYMPLWLRLRHDDDLAPAIDTLRELMLDDTIRMVPQLLSAPLLASALSERTQWWEGEGPIPDAEIDRMARGLDIGRWTMRFALYGDEAVVDHRFAKIKEAFERIPDADVYGSKCAPEDIPQLEHPVERVQGGVPSMDLNQMTAWYGGEEGGHIGFSPVAPLTGSDAIAVRDLLRGMIESAGLDYMAALIPINARSFIHVTLIIFDTKNEEQTRAAYDVAKRLVRDCAKLGYGEYRAHLDFMDLASEQYGFNDHAYRRFNETIKDALDPNGILAPGKSGIWPKAMRERR
ncbi:MAG: 4-cresol dehydrogenase (hydroxylating) flavoprotein subunit [Thermoleophilaceae bacterium]|nr:4-cresol dehydrogenase (hydroxylating) flavoprotein subunit [Thermoleophilaceae bacterium]